MYFSSFLHYYISRLTFLRIFFCCSAILAPPEIWRPTVSGAVGGAMAPGPHLASSPLVRPHVEYCNTIWGPFFQKDIKQIEAVQRRATTLIAGIGDRSYEERLIQLGLPSLAYRRRRGDMIWMYKIKNGLVRLNFETFLQPATQRIRRGHSQRVFKHHAVKVARSSSFSQRVVNDWNNLTSHVVDAPSLNENRLDEHWGDIQFTAYG